MIIDDNVNLKRIYNGFITMYVGTKIDKSFIHGVPDDGYDAAIVESTMLMAKYLGLNVVAEGVENPKQLNFLKHHDCQLYQGICIASRVRQ